MTDLAWIDIAFTNARPQVLGALLRYFRNLDIAEEAFQEACLRALKTWPDKGPPRDPVAWLIFVGRNSGIDAVRKQAKTQGLPDEEAISDTGDAESDLADRLDGSNYRDDILRLLFICCHPDLPATQQIALALRVVSGLSVAQIARAFLVSESAMEQRITRAKARVAAAGVPFETPGAVERSRARGARQRHDLSRSTTRAIPPAGRAARLPPLPTRRSGLGRLLLRIFPAEPEIMGLLALMLLQQSRKAARFDADGQIILLEDQDRSLWNRESIDEALALLDKAIRHRRPGPYQVQAAIAALHSQAPSGPRIRTGRRSICSIRRWSGCTHRRSSRSTAPSRLPNSRDRRRRWRWSSRWRTSSIAIFIFMGLGAVCWCSWAGRTRRTWPSIVPSRLPIHPPKLPISAISSTVSKRRGSGVAK